MCEPPNLEQGIPEGNGRGGEIRRKFLQNVAICEPPKCGARDSQAHRAATSWLCVFEQLDISSGTRASYVLKVFDNQGVGRSNSCLHLGVDRRYVFDLDSIMTQRNDVVGP